MFRLLASKGIVEGKRTFSKEASSRSAGKGQDRPALSARSRYSLIVVRPTPQLPAACLADKPFSQQRRKISFIFLIDSLVFATFAPCRFGKSVSWHFHEIDQRVLEGSFGVAGFIGIGGRFGSYWVAGFNHIGWPLWIGTGGRFASEYAPCGRRRRGLSFSLFSPRGYGISTRGKSLSSSRRSTRIRSIWS